MTQEENARADNPELVEAVARQICVTVGINPDDTGYGVTLKTKERLGAQYPLWKYQIPAAKAAIAAHNEFLEKQK